MKQKIKREQLFPKKKLGPVILMAMMGGLGITPASAVSGSEATTPPAITTVFLVCEGVFTLESDWLTDTPPETFDGSIYVSITRKQDRFTQIKLQPFAKSERLRSQTFVADGKVIDANLPQNESANSGKELAETYSVEINATNDEIIMAERRESGSRVKARVGDRPLVPTRMEVQTVDMTLNRFSGKMRMVWGDRKVHDVRPAGAIRATKVTYLDQKSFEASCHTMKERLF